MTTVLVTGGSGFIGSHCIAALLAAGHDVRTTVRQPARETTLRSTLAVLGVPATASIDIALANLDADAGWAEAVAGCTHVLHVASPLPLAQPRDPAELITPAREGTLRVLRAARDAGVSRVVLTSSFAAIGYGHAALPPTYDETWWTEPNAAASAYVQSKTLAERAAWDFMAAARAAGSPMELTTINPVAVLGPVPVAESSASIELVRRLLAGRVPACPRIWFGVVDIRDVVDLHLLGMTAPAAAGERFLAAAGPCLSLLDLATILRDALPAFAPRLPTRTLPDWLVRLAARIRPDLRPTLPELGRRKDMSHAKATRLLGWTPRPNRDAILATADSLLRLGLVKPPS